MTSATNTGTTYQTRSLVRALAILDAFTSDRPTLRVNDLHELLDLPKPTISRLASVLKQHGLLVGDGRGYQLGPKTFELGALFAQQNGLRDAGRAALEATARETVQTSSLAVLSGRHVLNLLVAKPPRPIHHVTEAGNRDPAHTTGLGKALLSALTDEEVDEVLGSEPLERMTPQTICDRKGLYAELGKSRRRGYALDREEFANGLRCIAIQVDLPRLGRAAISLSGPASDYAPGMLPKHLARLRQTADELVEAFGTAADYSLPTPIGTSSGAMS
jgi:IclR family transcriptional regulator, acetate operon repressor